MKMSDEAVQRFVAEDVNRGAIVLATWRFYVNNAFSPAHPRAGLPRADQLLAERSLASLLRVLREHPGNRAADHSLRWDVVDRLLGHASDERRREQRGLSKFQSRFSFCCHLLALSSSYST